MWRNNLRRSGIFFAPFWLPIGLLFFIGASSFAQEQQFRFERFGVEHGLPSGQILCILEDRTGFLWLGTMKGLVRYDGHHFKLFASVPGDSTSLSNPVVTSICEDRQGHLWVGTHSGLNRYDPGTNTFRQYFHRPGDEQNLPGNLLLGISQDSSGRVWLSTDGGSGSMDPKSGKFTRLRWADKTDTLHDRGIRVGGLHRTRSGMYRSGSNYGILIVDPVEYTVRLPDPAIYAHIQTPPATQFLEKKPDRLLFFHYNDEICFWDPESDQLLKLVLPGMQWPEVPYTFYPDAGKGLWIVFRNNGLWYYSLENQKITHLQHSPDNEFGLGESLILSTCYDRFHNLWIGSYNGLYRINMAAQRFPFFQQKPGLRKAENQIYRTYEDQRGGWWFSTYDGRLFYSATPGQKARELRVPLVNGRTTKIGVFHPISDDIIWLAAHHYGIYNGHGLFQYNYRSGSLRRLDLGDTLNRTSIGFMETDRDHPRYIWLGAIDGLCRLDKKTLRREWFFPRNSDTSIRSNAIHTAIQTHDKIWMQIGPNVSGELGYFDKKTLRFALLDIGPKMPGGQLELVCRGMTQTPDGTIWLATGQGLGRLDPVTQAFDLLTVRDGLAETELMGIARDKKGKLWLKGLKSIACFDPVLSGATAFRRFPIGKDMLEFNTVGATASRDGLILLHGNNGIYAFHPDLIWRDTAPPKVVLADFKILDRSKNLGRSPELADSISIRYYDHIITFEFAALHFTEPELVQYQYRLDGFHEDWLHNGTDRKVTFTNLPPGRYTFRVQACNTDGVCSGEKEELAVYLQVLPPWWATWWAWVLFGLTALGMIQAVFRFRLRQKLVRAEALRFKELDAFKTRFYTNITHEFRTPLTLILGPVTNSLQKNQPMTEAELHLVKRNSERLLQLVNQMLDLSKLDAGMLTAHYVQADVVPFLRYLVESFHSHAQSRGVALGFATDTDHLVLDIDKEKWQSIVVNLLSNAIKFTPAGGKITVALENGEQLRLTIRDTGVGIGAAELPFIFDRFYQADDSPTRSSEGVGIGLALAKELVGLLGGKIGVESEPGRGTVFTLTFPVRRTASPEEATMPVVPLTGLPADLPQNQPPSAHKLIILIIEDHPEAARYIASCVGPNFRTLFASDGMQGLELAFGIIPDLVICDVMMPEKDGFEVCKILKRDERTSHIPLILLTAKADTASRLEGLGMGADAYLLKPFNETELRIRVDKMLELRRSLQEHYRKTPMQPIGPVTKPDDAFMQKLRGIVEAHLTDHRFHVETFARLAGMSLPQLHRKVTALTGHSAGHFIRFIRLQKAREMLTQSDLRISEIAYDCGFGSPAHFTHAFTEEFGLSPSAFRASLRK